MIPMHLASDSAVLRTLPFGSLNKRICGSLTLAQICSAIAPQTSHIPGKLAETAAKKGGLDEGV